MCDEREDEGAALRQALAAAERRAAELEAQLAHTVANADYYLRQLKKKNLMASGLMVRLNFLGGKEAIPPVVIANGISQETIDCLIKDVERTWIHVTQIKPVGLRKAEGEEEVP